MNYDFYDDISFSNNYTPFDENIVNNFGINNIPNFDGTNAQYNPINDNNLMLFNSYEGYLKGNSFKDEYIPYKNYKVAKLNINNEREELLVNIGEASFMMHDLNLYLDVHPNDVEALRKFSEYRNKSNELITKYERKDGPLAVKGDVSTNTPFNWVTTSWPWVK